MKCYLLCSALSLLAGGACEQPVEPAACTYTVTVDRASYAYQFDAQGRVTYVAYRPANPTLSNAELDYRFTYQGRQATIDVTYPRLDYMRFRDTVTLNEQGYALSIRETMFLRDGNGVFAESLTTSYTCTYDGEGYLTTYQQDRFSYPPPGNKRTLNETKEARFSYQDGNPVTVTYGSGQERITAVGTMQNRYGPQVNPLKMAFAIEANPFSVSPDRALLPLLGKPARNLPTSSVVKGSTTNVTTDYSYRFDASGRLVSAGRAGNSAPFNLSFEDTCR